MNDTLLTDLQQTVLTLLAEGSTLSAAAEAAGVQTNTVTGWRTNSQEFNQAWQVALHEQAVNWRNQMQALARETRHGAFDGKKLAYSIYPVLGEVSDVRGRKWNIREIRPTHHGFELLYGSPHNNNGGYRGGVPRLIVTEELRDFWVVNKHEGHGRLYDLPAGRTTLKRARKALGMNFGNDRLEFWTDRLDDLNSMTAREFADKHEVTRYAVGEWRLRITGKRIARARGWWRTPDIREVLLSDLCFRRMGEKLGISISQAFRLRLRAKLEQAAEDASPEVAPLRAEARPIRRTRFI